MLINNSFDLKQVADSCNLSLTDLKKLIIENKEIAKLFIIQNGEYFLPVLNVSALNNSIGMFSRKDFSKENR